MAGESILVVEDNDTNLRLFVFLLSAKGYQVRGATDARQALELLRNFRPRLILMDLQLPGTDGYELTRRLKADPDTRDILIIALTAYAMRGDEEKALAAGCDGYITKPIDTRALPVRIAEYLASGPHGPPDAGS
jgi:two-component system cell cycle response regulator DivK